MQTTPSPVHFSEPELCLAITDAVAREDESALQKVLAEAERRHCRVIFPAVDIAAMLLCLNQKLKSPIASSSLKAMLEKSREVWLQQYQAALNSQI